MYLKIKMKTLIKPKANISLHLWLYHLQCDTYNIHLKYYAVFSEELFTKQKKLNLKAIQQSVR